MTRHTPVPGSTVDEEARQLARRDGARAAAWVAAYLKSHGHGPRTPELRMAMGWPAPLEWPVLGRLQKRGWVELTDGEERSLRPGPAFLEQPGARQ